MTEPTGYTLGDGRTVEAGTEVTVRWINSITGKTTKFRAIFQGVREKDGSLDLYRPERGYASAPSDAEITIHRSTRLQQVVSRKSSRRGK